MPGRGGAASVDAAVTDLSLGDLTRQLDALTRQLDDRGDKLGVLESLLTLDSARKKLIPTMLPVQGGMVLVELRLAHRPVQRAARLSRRHRLIAEQGTRGPRGGRRRGRLLRLPSAVW